MEMESPIWFPCGWTFISHLPLRGALCSGSTTVPCGYNQPSGIDLCTNPPAVRGTLGVPASTNAPPGGLAASSWMDKQGNFWLFGTVDNLDISGEFEGRSEESRV